MNFVASSRWIPDLKYFAKNKALHSTSKSYSYKKLAKTESLGKNDDYTSQSSVQIPNCVYKSFEKLPFIAYLESKRNQRRLWIFEHRCVWILCLVKCLMYHIYAEKVYSILKRYDFTLNDVIDDEIIFLFFLHSIDCSFFKMICYHCVIIMSRVVSLSVIEKIDFQTINKLVNFLFRFAVYASTFFPFEADHKTLTHFNLNVTKQLKVFWILKTN